METIIDDDLISIISNGSFEILDDDENTIIIDGVEINKNEYLKTLHILQNISNKKKEKEDEIKSIDKLNEYKNKLMELYIELYLYDNIEYLLNDIDIISSTYSCYCGNPIYDYGPKSNIIRENKKNVINEFKKTIINDKINKLILDIEKIKTDIYILINKNYNIMCKNNINKISILTKYKLYLENNDILNNILNNIKLKLFNICIECMIQVEITNLEYVKNSDFKHQYEKSYQYEIDRINKYKTNLLNYDDCEKMYKLLEKDFPVQTSKNTKYNDTYLLLNKDIIFNSIKLYYKDIEEIYDSVKKEYETKSIIKELNNYKKQNKLLSEELKNIKIILLKNNIK